VRRALEGLVQLIWGRDLDPALRPLLVVATASTIARTTAFVFLGIWALNELHATQVELSFGFLAGALAALASGYAGGHLSDHVGRRPVLLASYAGLALVPLGMLAAGDRLLAGLALVALLGVFGAAGGSVEDALVADLVPPEGREAGYAAVRVAKNLGVSFGPVLGGVLLIGDSWSRLFLGVFVLSAVAWALAFRFLPRAGRFMPDAPPQRGSFAVVRRDHAFLLFVGAMALASMTYVAFDALLAISLVDSHGFSPATWGFIVVINPILVTLVQLRLTRAVAGVPAPVKLAVAMPLMGVPFVLLQLEDGVAFVALLVLVFVFGEMLWVPTSQAVAAAFAPDDVRGAYMGVYGGSSQLAWAVTPFLGLQVRSAFGDAAMWAGIAGLSLVAATAGAAAARERRVSAAVASARA
jgi:predicted MFS family arabinose efflux permease